MLRHALESIEHGLVHFLDGTEIGRKFALLHLDHGIELAIKEAVVRLGHSIYQKEGRTIAFHQALNLLPSDAVPERPRLEDLHDFRNIVQHKGLTPDESTTDFYMKEGYAFACRFFKEMLEFDIMTSLPKAQIAALESADSLAAYDSAKRMADAHRLLSLGQYEMAVVSAFASMEATIKDTIPGAGWASTTAIAAVLLRDQPEMLKRFEEARLLRNSAAHGASSVSSCEAEAATAALGAFIEHLLRLRQDREAE